MASMKATDCSRGAPASWVMMLFSRSTALLIAFTTLYGFIGSESLLKYGSNSARISFLYFAINSLMSLLSIRDSPNSSLSLLVSSMMVSLVSPMRATSIDSSLLIESGLSTFWIIVLPDGICCEYGVRVKLVPSPNIVSQEVRNSFAANVVVVEPAPSESSWRSSKADLPGIVVKTGTDNSSANSWSSWVASAIRTPCPAHIIKLSDSLINSMASLMAESDGLKVNCLGNEYFVIISSGISLAHTSAGISTTTGPGRPFLRWWKALLIIAGISSTFSTVSACFEIGSYILLAQKLGATDIRSSEYPPGITKTGMLSAFAWAKAPIEFSAPAADCITNTPNFFLLLVLL